MADNFEQVLDRGLDRIRSGESVQAVLEDFPEHASRLRPLLLTAVRTGEAYSFTPSEQARAASRQRFMAAMVEAREARRVKQPWFNRLMSRRMMWAAIATTVVVAIIAYVGVRALVSPAAPEVAAYTPVPSATGNFVFQVSDEVNAIADFESVNVSISKIGVQESSDGKWIEFAPEVAQVDLTKVPGDITQQIWRGDMPSGGYSQVFVYVDNVSGVLKSTGQTTEIKLPSNKLHISKPFAVSGNATTRFTYDMTVFATGNGHNSKYILKPQVEQSGAAQEPSQSQGNSNHGNGNNGNSPIGRPTSLPTPAEKPTKKPR